MELVFEFVVSECIVGGCVCVVASVQADLVICVGVSSCVPELARACGMCVLGVCLPTVELSVSFMCVAVVISVTKEGVKFSTGGDIGSANIVCRQNTSVDKVGGVW